MHQQNGKIQVMIEAEKAVILTKRILAIGFSLLVLTSCGSIRKISQIEVRQLSSDESSNAISISGVRARLSALHSIPAKCGANIQEGFLALTMEKVAFPDCTPSMLGNFSKAAPLLEGEERNLIEEIVSSKCRSLSSESSLLTLDGFYQNFSTTGPLGRLRSTKNDNAEKAMQVEGLEAFRKGIEDTISEHSPIDRWVKKNGEYVLPDDDLIFFEDFFIKHSCERKYLEVEEGYRAVRNLELILKHLASPKARERGEKMLAGLYQTIDQRAKELFFSHE